MKNNVCAFFCYRVVVLESHLLRTATLTSAEECHDLYILAGHEASY